MTWTPVCPSTDLPEGGAWPVFVEGNEICLYRVENELYATSDRCTHGNANLSGGSLEGHEIECPLHQGRFDIRSGAPTHAPCTAAVRTYPVREVDGTIYVDLAKERER